MSSKKKRVVDINGNAVLHKDGKQMYVDENGKLINKQQDDPDKKTVFISMIGATEADIESLYQEIQNVPGFADKYHGILTSHPVQVMDPKEVIESMTNIYNYVEDGDPNNVGITRTDRFRSHLRYSYDFMKGVTEMLEVMQANIDELTKAMNNHQHGQDPHTSNRYVSLMTTATNTELLRKYVELMEKHVKPKEGQYI